MRVWQEQSLYTKGMHRLNLLRPQERTLFFFSREESTIFLIGHIQRKIGDVLSLFVTDLCEGGETGGV